MGNVIYCETEESEIPYIFDNTRIAVYSYEELCYYIFQNYSLLTTKQLGEPLLQWMQEQLKLVELVQTLRQLMEQNCSMYEYLEVLLLSYNYYEKEEVLLLFERMKEEERFPRNIQLKRQADRFVEFHKYTKAVLLYEEILKDENLEAELASQIYHNKAVALSKNWDFTAARQCFLKAYEASPNTLSLSCYFITYFVNQQMAEAEKQKEQLGIESDVYESIVAEYKRSTDNYQKSSSYEAFQKIQEDYAAGQSDRAKSKVSRFIKSWKEDYRMQNR